GDADSSGGGGAFRARSSSSKQMRPSRQTSGATYRLSRRPRPSSRICRYTFRLRPVPRSSVSRTERFRAPAAPPDQAMRELMAVREVIHAFLTADRPEEVYQFALERVSPLIGATFASVYLVDGASELMRLGAAYNWPQRFRPWLGEARVRLGFGPSGEAASERRTIEVADVFADDQLE